MNWKLVFQLSLLGLAMALGTVFLIPSSVEPICWLAIFLVCAYAVARRCRQKLFLHGLAIGIANSFWVTAAHILFFGQYIANHAKEAAMMKSMPLPDSPRLMMALTGPVIGVVSGVIIGVLCLLAGKVIKGARPETA
ncbi:MAG: hypothetical protein JOZ89_00750 [Gammaproteobacteria bacterium]|nr:hypothetical protein [Gammaproteobacteria bacterium]